MVVSGLQIAKNKEHADIVAKVALGLVKYMKCTKLSHLSERRIDIRLGIHSGLGKSEYTYKPYGYFISFDCQPNFHLEIT